MGVFNPSPLEVALCCLFSGKSKHDNAQLICIIVLQIY